jgi:DNA-binding response OmpR family regulator
MAKRILVVDDEPDFLEILSVRLRAGGYEVEVAHNGEEALKKIQQFKPDLILSDVIMPKMDGVDFFHALRQDLQGRRIPVMIMTIKDQLEKAFRGLDVYDFIVKPINMDDFLSRVQACLNV